MTKVTKIRTMIHNFLQQFTYTKVFSSFSWLIGYRVMTLITGVVVSAMLARYFGPETYGLFNYALAFVLMFTSLSSLGLETITVQEVLNDKYETNTIISTSVLLQIFSGLFLSVIINVIVHFIQPSNSDLHILVFILSCTLSFKSLEVYEHVIQAYHEAKVSSISRIIVYIIILIFKVLIIVYEGSIFHFSLLYLLEVILAGGFLFIAYTRFMNNPLKISFNIEYAKYALSKSWYLMISGLIVMIYTQIDKIMLGSLLESTKDIGIYSVATQISKMWYFIPLAIITTYKPIVIKYKNRSKELYILNVQFLYGIIAWIGIIFGAFLFLFSKPIINMLFGPDYVDAVQIMQILVWSGTFATLGSARGVWLVIEGLQKYSIVYIGMGAIVNVLLNLILIPKIGGLGAAYGTLIAQITVAVIAPMIFKDTRISVLMILKAFNIRNVILNFKKIVSLNVK